MRQSKPEKIAGAIRELTRQNKDLTDAAIAELSGLPEPVVMEILDAQLGIVWGKLPAGWKIGRAPGMNAVVVSRP